MLSLGKRSAGMDAAPIIVQEQAPASDQPEGQVADGEGKEAVLQRRVNLLLSTATATIFDYIAQALVFAVNGGRDAE